MIDYDPDKARTGRTTSIALYAMSKAISAAGNWVQVNDHYTGRSGAEALSTAIMEISRNANLSFDVKLNPDDWSVGIRCSFKF